MSAVSSSSTISTIFLPTDASRTMSILARASKIPFRRAAIATTGSSRNNATVREPLIQKLGLFAVLLFCSRRCRFFNVEHTPGRLVGDNYHNHATPHECLCPDGRTPTNTSHMNYMFRDVHLHTAVVVPHLSKREHSLWHGRFLFCCCCCCYYFYCCCCCCARLYALLLLYLRSSIHL